MLGRLTAAMTLTASRWSAFLSDVLMLIFDITVRNKFVNCYCLYCRAQSPIPKFCEMAFYSAVYCGMTFLNLRPEIKMVYSFILFHWLVKLCMIIYDVWNIFLILQLQVIVNASLNIVTSQQTREYSLHWCLFCKLPLPLLSILCVCCMSAVCLCSASRLFWISCYYLLL